MRDLKIANPSSGEMEPCTDCDNLKAELAQVKKSFYSSNRQIAQLEADLEREREANAKLREALIHIYEPAQNRECCMRAMKEDELDNHMVEIAFNATHDEPLLAAKQDKTN